MHSEFRVGDGLVRPQLHTIERARRTIHVEPKVMKVLVCLAEHKGEVLPKERLMQVV